MLFSNSASQTRFSDCVVAVSAGLHMPAHYSARCYWPCASGRRPFRWVTVVTCSKGVPVERSSTAFCSCPEEARRGRRPCRRVVQRAAKHTHLCQEMDKSRSLVVCPELYAPNCNGCRRHGRRLPSAVTCHLSAERAELIVLDRACCNAWELVYLRCYWLSPFGRANRAPLFSPLNTSLGSRYTSVLLNRRLSDMRAGSILSDARAQ